MLCGLICSWKYGLVVGAVTPLLRSFVFHAPVLYPGAVAMAFELAVYGGLIGLLYGKSEWKCTVSLYRSLLISMVAGRVVWGIVMTFLVGFGKFTFEAFLAGAVTEAVPGIVIQLILIPVVMVALSRAKLVPFSKTLGKKRKRQ